MKNGPFLLPAYQLHPEVSFKCIDVETGDGALWTEEEAWPASGVHVMLGKEVEKILTKELGDDDIR